MTITPGTRFGRYEVRSLLGAGGMGEVYLAWDHDLDGSGGAVVQCVAARRWIGRDPVRTHLPGGAGRLSFHGGTF